MDQKGWVCHDNANTNALLFRIGTAMAFLTQITFTASVWQTYDQQIWRHLNKPLRMATLNDILGAQASMTPYLNVEYLRVFPLGYFMGLFAW